MKHCKAIRKDKQRCAAPAGPDGFCTFHSPAHGKARAEGRKRGGLRRRAPHAGNPDALPQQVRTLDDVLAVLDYALAEALPLENSVQRGRLVVAIAHAFIEAIKTGELEKRLADIEAALKIGDVATNAGQPLP
jgi:hypothetical protein